MQKPDILAITIFMKHAASEEVDCL